jgi:hypothetical protein
MNGNISSENITVFRGYTLASQHRVLGSIPGVTSCEIQNRWSATRAGFYPNFFSFPLVINIPLSSILIYHCPLSCCSVVLIRQLIITYIVKVGASSLTQHLANCRERKLNLTDLGNKYGSSKHEVLNYDILYMHGFQCIFFLYFSL